MVRHKLSKRDWRIPLLESLFHHFCWEPLAVALKISGRVLFMFASIKGGES